MEIIQLCLTYFCFELPSVLLKNRNKYNEYHYTRYDIQMSYIKYT